MEPHGAPRLPGAVDDAAGPTAGAPAADRGSRPKERLRALYFGSSPAAARFQHVLLASDLVTLGFFLVTAFVRVAPWVAAVNLLIALALTADFGARCWIAERPLRHLLRPAAVADLVVIVSLLASALTSASCGCCVRCG